MQVAHYSWRRVDSWLGVWAPWHRMLGGPGGNTNTNPNTHQPGSHGNQNQNAGGNTNTGNKNTGSHNGNAAVNSGSSSSGSGKPPKASTNSNTASAAGAAGTSGNASTANKTIVGPPGTPMSEAKPLDWRTLSERRRDSANSSPSRRSNSDAAEVVENQRLLGDDSITILCHTVTLSEMIQNAKWSVDPGMTKLISILRCLPV
jgi:hypothetical protein